MSDLNRLFFASSFPLRVIIQFLSLLPQIGDAKHARVAVLLLLLLVALVLLLLLLLLLLIRRTRRRCPRSIIVPTLHLASSCCLRRLVHHALQQARCDADAVLRWGALLP